MNPDTHEVMPLHLLTDEQRAKWVAEHEETKARLEALFPRESMQDATFAQQALFKRFSAPVSIPGAPGSERRGGFDANGKPRF